MVVIISSNPLHEVLLSSYLLGWGCTPRGTAMKVTERDFAGSAYHERGKGEKVALAERLLRSIAFVGEDPANATREEIAEKVDSVSDTDSPKNNA
ncbi:hypothetical protein FJZ27_05145 [Candidatus Peribacteria bacterium]|nr:hypothetical protein [Candidatus Peribacteria bacterium]